MNTSLCHKLIRYGIFAFVILGLSSCADTPVTNKPVRPVKTSKSQPSAKQAEIVKDAGEDKENNENDAKQVVEEIKSQPLLVIEYKNSGDKTMHEDIIPVAQDSNGFPGLADELNKLAGKKSTLHNLYIVNQNKDKPEIIEKLPVKNEINIEFRLIRFFIDNRQRDAAYITVDNAKKSLVVLASDAQANEESRQLSQELENLENELRKAMPFTL